LLTIRAVVHERRPHDLACVSRVDVHGLHASRHEVARFPRMRAISFRTGRSGCRLRADGRGSLPSTRRVTGRLPSGCQSIHARRIAYVFSASGTSGSFSGSAILYRCDARVRSADRIRQRRVKSFAASLSGYRCAVSKGIVPRLWRDDPARGDGHRPGARTRDSLTDLPACGRPETGNAPDPACPREVRGSRRSSDRPA
jgi:hypothetical protein